MNVKNNIILNLAMATDVARLKYDQVFQTEARQTIFDKIKRQLELINKGERNYDDLFYERYHNAITISGPRGSGKSTFLRHILTCLNDPETVEDSDNRKFIPKKLSVLRIIDPTLISSKEHVLIILISQIRDVISKFTHSMSSEKYKKYEDALRDLAGGLCQIDGIGAANYGDEWEDKTYILEKGLEKATEGRNLERNLNKFIDAALDVIDKNAFVVTFDDIDTQFERGWPVLETVRKYLTSDKWVVLISGDIELYSILVKSAQYKSLGDEVMKYERPSLNYHKERELPSYENDDLVSKASELEEQYLMKVLKPENRVHMLTLHQKAVLSDSDSNITNISIIESDDKSSQAYELENVLDIFMEKCLGFTRKHEIKMAYSGLLSLPTRTLLQLIKSIADDLKLGFFIGNGRLDDFDIKKPQFEQFTSRVISIFSSNFSRYGVRQSDLNVAEYSSVKLAREFLNWAIKDKCWKELDRLNTSSDNESYNARVFTFLTLISKHTKFDISEAFKWMVLSSFSMHLATSVKYINDKGDLGLIDKHTLLDYLGINDKFHNIIVTTQKALFAQITGDNKNVTPDKFGLVTVPAYKEIGLQFENILERFYEVDDMKIDINSVSETTEKTEKRDQWKAAYHDAIFKLVNSGSDFSEFKEFSEWFNSISGVYEELGDGFSKKRTGGVIFNSLESIIENYDLGYFVNLPKISVREYKKSSETNFLSAISILACIFELKGLENHNEEAVIKNIFDMLPQQALLPPRSIHEEDESLVEEGENDSSLSEASNYEGGFYKNILLWLDNVDKYWPDLFLSNNALNSLFSDFILNVPNLKQSEAVGAILHSQLVLFLHYCLIQDATRKGLYGLTTKSLNTTEKEFHANIKKYTLNSDLLAQIEVDNQRTNFYSVHKELLIDPKTSIFGLMLSCPIIGLFLRDKPVDKSNDDGWSWHKAHANSFIRLTEENEAFYRKVNENTKNVEMLKSLNSVKSTEKKKSDYLAGQYSDYLNSLKEYLGAIKVSGTVDKVEIEFSNLYPILNTLPITSLTAKQSLNIPLVIRASKQAPPPPAPPLSTVSDKVVDNKDDGTQIPTMGKSDKPNSGAN